MIRRAYTVRLEPGALAEYRQKHDNIWPELVEVFRTAGIAQLSAFEADPIVFYYAEITNEDAFDRLFGSEVLARWGAQFEGLMAFNAEGAPETLFMDQIFHLETGAA
jgi:L-rhamnose mutarotase